jgi:hypothetical protein
LPPFSAAFNKILYISDYSKYSINNNIFKSAKNGNSVLGEAVSIFTAKIAKKQWEMVKKIYQFAIL